MRNSRDPNNGLANPTVPPDGRIIQRTGASRGWHFTSWRVIAFLGLAAAVTLTVGAGWQSIGPGVAAVIAFLVFYFGAMLLYAQDLRRGAERRSRNLGTLLEVSQAAAATLNHEQLTGSVVDAIRRADNFHTVTLTTAPNDVALPSLVAVSTDPENPSRCALEPQHSQHPGCVSASVEVGGNGLLLRACKPLGAEFTSEERTMLRAAAEQLRIGLEKSALYESLVVSEKAQRRLTARLVSAQEDERKRIVGDIHDGLGQDLHRVLFGLRGCLSSPPKEVSDQLQHLEELMDQSSRRLRRLLEDLRPSTLEDVGLAASLRSLVDRVSKQDGLAVTLDVGDVAEPPIPVRLAVFRIAQEALHNVAKHAGTKSACVMLERANGALRLSIEDKGAGVSPNGSNEGLGLLLMRERAEAFGGTLSIESSPGGTRILADIPLQAPQS